MAIRQALPGDAGTINRLAEEIWWPTYESIVGAEQVRYMLDAFYSVPALERQITSGEQTFLMLEEEGMPIGFAAYAPRVEDAEIYKLHKLYCLTKLQGKGYGKMLVAAVEDAVIAAGKYMLDLNVNRYNKARFFYEKLGFEVIYEEDVPIGEYWMNDYVMRKVL